MKSSVACSLVVGLALVIAMKSACAAPPEAPQVSSFAPAEDLVTQVGDYITELKSEVESENEYNASKEAIAKQANTLVVLTLALGLHDSDNKYKASAATMMKNAQDLAAAQDYAAAKKALAAIESADGTSTGLKWEKVASLEQLMKQVPTIHNKLKKGVEPSKFKKKLAATAGQSAVLAVIAQGSMADTSATKSDEQVKQWYDFCTKMHDAAAAVNAGIHKKDASATKSAMAKLNQSCDDCHAVFKKDKEGK